VGSVLIFTLLMLIFLQWVAVAVVNSTNISSYVVRNFQSTGEIERAANNLINYVIKNKDYFVNYHAYLNENNKFNISLPVELLSDIKGEIISFKCIAIDLIPQSQCGIDNEYWELVVVANNSKGFSVKMAQGLKLSIVSEAKIKDESLVLNEILIEGVWWYQANDY